MAKLYFRYGAMNAGKSTALLQVKHNYEERGMSTLLIKPAIDTKGADKVVSRIGINASVDILLDKTDVIMAKVPLQKPNAIIVDEAHHTLANTYNRLWKLYPNSWKLGVTATPCRLNCATFGHHFDRIVESLSVKELIKEGYLSDYTFYTENPDSDLSKAIESIKGKSSTGDYRIEDLLHNLNVESHIQKLILCYTKYAEGLKGIVYAISIEHAHNICEAYKTIGVLYASHILWACSILIAYTMPFNPSAYFV